MEGLCLLLPAVLLLTAPGSILTLDRDAYFIVGDPLVLKLPETVSQPLIAILWKYNGNLLAEAWSDVLDYYSTFKGRATLDKTTGSLTIQNMGSEDAGVYTVEINNRPQSDRYIVKEIKKVPKPEVHLQTSASNGYQLTCDGDTAGAEPVTYSWKMGDEPWKKSEKSIHVNYEEITCVERFSCRVTNPVSVEESEPQQNPFSSAAVEGKTTHFVHGGTLVLKPCKARSQPIIAILWKYNGNLLAEAWSDMLDYYSTFKGRTTLDKTTGSLTIQNMGSEDAGVYTLEINNQPQSDRYIVKEMKKVPKPEVQLQTSASNGYQLTCAGDTTGAEPVTYSWKTGDEPWKKSEKRLTVTNTAEIQRAGTFSCKMKNLVSEEESDPEHLPLFLSTI